MFSSLCIKLKIIAAAFLLSIAILGVGCGSSQPPTGASTPPPPAMAMSGEVSASEQAIRFLEERVKKDGEDFIALNKLASYYLQRLRETGNVRFLELAGKAAASSLAVLPKEQNLNALAALAQCEFASHNFIAARDYARDLDRLDPTSGYAAQLLADSLLELGDYDQASTTFVNLQRRGQSAGVETRLARWALLRGDVESARQRFSNAIILTQNERVPSGESLAWLRWQLGEVYFSVGDYENAERAYQEALATLPNYYRAVASLGRALAAKGDLDAAIEQYERVARLLPEPAYLAALGDLYQVAGRDKEAAAQYALVEQVNRLNRANGALYSRQMALFFADHDIRKEEAYAQAKAEYAARRDIYGADALAWAALKAGKVAEAQAAIKEALKLGTRDAKFFYHAGMIAKAAGEAEAARDYLQRALSLSPRFDPLQAFDARRALESLSQ